MLVSKSQASRRRAFPDPSTQGGTCRPTNFPGLVGQQKSCSCSEACNISKLDSHLRCHPILGEVRNASGRGAFGNNCSGAVSGCCTVPGDQPTHRVLVGLQLPTGIGWSAATSHNFDVPLAAVFSACSTWSTTTDKHARRGGASCQLRRHSGSRVQHLLCLVHDRRRLTAWQRARQIGRHSGGRVPHLLHLVHEHGQAQHKHGPDTRPSRAPR